MKNIAVIGTGYWGKNLVRNFHALDALHTVCDSTSAFFSRQYINSLARHKEAEKKK
jgi:UDP-2-acetamido-3-amino-2,3-dideoxy-glucuronate N-acetyltransferase